MTQKSKPLIFGHKMHQISTDYPQAHSALNMQRISSPPKDPQHNKMFCHTLF